MAKEFYELQENPTEEISSDDLAQMIERGETTICGAKVIVHDQH